MGRARLLRLLLLTVPSPVRRPVESHGIAQQATCPRKRCQGWDAGRRLREGEASATGWAFPGETRDSGHSAGRGTVLTFL